MTPHLNSAEIFVQVSSSYVYLLGSCRVDKHTYKQTDAAEKNPMLFSTLRRWVGLIISAFVDVRLK